MAETQNLSKEEFVRKYTKDYEISWHSAIGLRSNLLDKLHRKVYSAHIRLQDFAYEDTNESWDKYFKYLHRTVRPAEWEYYTEYYKTLLKIKQGKIKIDFAINLSEQELKDYIKDYDGKE